MLNTKHFSQNEALEEIKNIDPRLIVGIAANQTEVVMAVLEKLLPISEKITIPLPREIFLEHTMIKSVQQVLTSEFGHATIAEVVGELNALVKTIAKQIARRMAELRITHCFSPAYAEEAGNLFICYNSSQRFLPLTTDAKNIRIVNIQTLFFVYDKKEIRQISFRYLGEKDWLKYSLRLFKSEEEIVFLGRLKYIFLPVTMKSGKAYFLNIFTGVLEYQHQLTNNEINAFVGEIEKNTIGAVTKDNDLVLCPR